MNIISLKNQTACISFLENDNKIFLYELNFDGKSYKNTQILSPLSCVFVTGGKYLSRNFNNICAQGENLFYVGHKIERYGDCRILTIKEQNDNLEVVTRFTLYDGCSVIECVKRVTNISATPVNLECVNPLTIGGLLYSDDKVLPALWQADNTHCMEVAFTKKQFEKEGFGGFGRVDRRGKVSLTGNGSQTTNEHLPLGLLEKDGKVFYYELHPVGSWNYEFSVDDGGLCLALSGKTFYRNGWYKKLAPAESYDTETVCITGGGNAERVARELTKYRRLQKTSAHDLTEKVIYNNFMQNTFAQPSENLDEKCLRFLKKISPDYYVLDAGWHDEGSENDIVTKIGKWDENTDNYPSGVEAIFKKIRGQNMRPGLWVEIQSIGVNSKNIGLPEECYFHIGSVRCQAHGRYQLNFAVEKTRDYATAIVKKLVGKYNPEYLKIDYNQTQIGTDSVNGSFAEGLREHCLSYYNWLSQIRAEYPDIIIESCSSGGMCMDGTALRHCDLTSVSDLENYKYYPYICGNLPIAMLPEKAGIWVMPVKKCQTTDNEKIIFNVSNALYGVMHLSSDMTCLTEEQFALLNDGIRLYKSLAEYKKTGYPLLVNGLTQIDDDYVVTGLITPTKIYMTVFNIKRGGEIEIDLTPYGVRSATPVYPEIINDKWTFGQGVLKINLAVNTARTFLLETVGLKP